MEVDSPPTTNLNKNNNNNSSNNNSSANNNSSNVSKDTKTGIERMIELGRELLQMSLRLEKKYDNVNDEIIVQNRKMMEVCLTI